MSDFQGPTSQSSDIALKGRDAAGTKRFLSRSSEIADSLVFRQVSSTGNFVRTVTCKPGNITIIQGGEDSIEPFCTAMAQGSSSETVMLRLGARELYPSEVDVVKCANNMWTERRVIDVLTRVGVSDELVSGALEYLGLADFRELSPTKLDECATRKLNFFCSLYSRSRVLCYDSPFLNMPSLWLERLAVLLEEAAQDWDKIVVMARLDRIPAFWHNSPRVLVEQISPMRTRKLSHVSSDEEMRKAVSEVRMILERQQSAECQCFVTRPQVIKNLLVRATPREAMRTEAIVNPQLSSDLGIGAREKKLSAEPSVLAQDKKRKGRNSLTRISGIQRMLKRSPIYRKYYYFKQWLDRKLINKQPDEAVQPAVKISMLLRKKKMSGRFLLSAFVAAAIIVCLYLSLIDFI
ncbi:MAG: hypothetical protein IT291_06675 [Deltaproteobacteria bacterium]|nr:hypothetical protein [Deltaproteobacteria bacterium]